MTATFPVMLYGGDYNPEQWPKDIWVEDMRLFHEARLNCVTINVFAWASLQPSEEEYDFSVLDEIVSMAVSEKMSIVMGTSTGSLPAWMCRRHPDVNRTDFEGRAHRFSHRHNACPNSPTFQKYSPLLAGKLAQRYGQLDQLVCWHVSNEYGGACYCENCAAAFRVWAEARYGTIAAVNKAWNMKFWGHDLSDWADIVVPNALGDAIGQTKSAFAGLSLDYRRFMTDSLLGNYLAEKAAIRQFDATGPVTTNLMAGYDGIDYRQFAPHLDVVSWDSYPAYNTPASDVGFCHDLMRGLKGSSFMLMEQTPSQQNWQPYNALKRPGQMRQISYQAVAHGADTIQFFQLRRSVGGCEKFHGAVIDHVGTDQTRVFREVSALGGELERLGDTLINAENPAQVAVVFDYPTWWGVQLLSGPTVELDYREQVLGFYREFYRRNIDVDVVGLDADLTDYDLVVTPCAYMMTADQARAIESYVQGGGRFVTGTMSGLVDPNDNVHLGGYPGVLRHLTGVWVEEFDALPPGVTLPVESEAGRGACSILCDIIHPEAATVLASLGGHEFYSGGPAITRNTFGQGAAYYVGACLDEAAMGLLFDAVLSDAGVSGIDLPDQVESRVRVKDSRAYRFLLNHSGDEVWADGFSGVDILTGQAVSGPIKLEGYGVAIINES